ncbi:hypothetical protein [Bartonella bovis]|nr:hypothetical protein [Bartonella bovis]
MNMGSITIKSGAGNYGVKVGGTASATLMRTEIKGSGKGKGTGVIMESGGGMVMDGVWISDVTTGLEVKSGTLKMMGGTKITVKEDGTGLSVSGTAMATLMGAEIRGVGTGYGVYVGGGTVMMDRVWIEGVSEGVEVMGSGRLVMMGESTIIFTGGEGSYGVKVGETADATLMGTEIKGTGMGYGVYISGGAVMLSGVNISKVEKGVEVTNGRLKMNMGSITVKSGAGNGNYGVGVWVSGMATAHLTDVKIRGRVDRGRGCIWGVGRW